MPIQHAFLVAGTHSGCGKTTITLALLAALQARGLMVQACKVGPDFIDPSHHSAFTARPSYNLDSWMGAEQGHMLRTYARMCQQAQDCSVLVAEGVMGLFDGAVGVGGPGSSAHVAKTLNIPIVLVVDVRGMGQSAAAVAAGFIHAQKSLSFAGIVCSHVGSDNHKHILQEAFAQLFPIHSPHYVPVLGYIPREEKFALSSRHLGLHMGAEQLWTAQRQKDLAAFAEQHIHIDALLARAPYLAKPETCSSTCTLTFHTPQQQKTKQRIGIAYDAAFSFLYADMPAVLEEMGAEVVFFSPLQDAHIPQECTALYFPGGYPELFAAQLACNESMLQSVRAFFAQEKRIYAECGGYIYMMRSVEYEGKSYPLCNILPVSATIGEKKAALGYREVSFITDAEQNTLQGRGHEFHYGKLTAPAHMPPLWHVTNRKGEDISHTEACGIRHKELFASWVHLYPEGARALLAHIFSL